MLQGTAPAHSRSTLRRRYLPTTGPDRPRFSIILTDSRAPLWWAVPAHGSRGELEDNPAQRSRRNSASRSRQIVPARSSRCSTRLEIQATSLAE